MISLTSRNLSVMPRFGAADPNKARKQLTARLQARNPGSSAEQVEQEVDKLIKQGQRAGLIGLIEQDKPAPS